MGINTRSKCKSSIEKSENRKIKLTKKINTSATKNYLKELTGEFKNIFIKMDGVVKKVSNLSLEGNISENWRKFQQNYTIFR